jgi:hypothetical protein
MVASPPPARCSRAERTFAPGDGDHWDSLNVAIMGTR